MSGYTGQLAGVYEIDLRSVKRVPRTFLEDLKLLMKDYPGDWAVGVRLETAKGEKRFCFGDNFRVDLCSELKAAVKSLLDAVDEYPDQADGYVYCIGSDSGPVKVGWSARPFDRVKDFQTGNHVPLRVIAVREGSRRDEKMLHQRLAPARVRGEWFQREAAFAQFGFWAA